MERLVDHGDADAIADEDGDGLTAGSQRAEVRSLFGSFWRPEAHNDECLKGIVCLRLAASRWIIFLPF